MARSYESITDAMKTFIAEQPMFFVATAPSVGGRVNVSPKPNIVRLYGSGRHVQPGDPEFDDLIDRFPDRSGIRSIVVADIDRTSTSCGYAVPFMDYVEDRERLEESLSAKADGELQDYWANKNATSIDGLPALDIIEEP